MTADGGRGEPDSSKRVYDGRVIGVTLERWGDAEREIVERADAATIVATDGDDRLILVRQPRAAAREDVVELPAGVVDDGEEPEAAARRELAEETGLHGGRWRRGPIVYSTPGYSRERVHFFLADGLEEGDDSQDEGEEITVLRLSRAEALRTLDDVRDAKTLAGMLLFLRDD